MTKFLSGISVNKLFMSSTQAIEPYDPSIGPSNITLDEIT